MIDHYALIADVLASLRTRLADATTTIFTRCKLAWARFCGPTTTPSHTRNPDMPVPAPIATALQQIEAIINPIVAENTALTAQVASLTEQLATEQQAAAASEAQDVSDTVAAINAFGSSLPQPATPAPADPVPTA